ncbi:MAG: translation initiation factor IF-2 subunit gamma [Methanobacteriota archaeon]|nr:MAG: translation initiation factor IF-2 subunit gamma [Euryarchaeota archaeon]
MDSVIVGLFGHVDHGKTTLTKALTGKWADTYSEEVIRGISIKLGYADMGIYECPDGSFWKDDKCKGKKGKGKLVKIVSFLDAPGHESLMATAISASAVIDGALLLIAANEECPQEQTKEHLMVLDMLGVKNIVVVQTKIDVVSKEQAIKNHNQIREFLKGTVAENAPIIPVSATYGVNLDKLLEAMHTTIKPIERDTKGEPLFYVLRSFDINKPGTPIEKLNGGVLGGVMAKGILKEGDDVKIIPGYISSKGETTSLSTKIASIHSYKGKEKEATPGKTLALGTLLDPSTTKGDKAAGSVVVLKKSDIAATNNIKVEYSMLKRSDMDNTQIKEGEVLLLNVGPSTTAGIVASATKKVLSINLKKPVANIKGEKVAIQRRAGQRWRLAGSGTLV